MRKRPLLFSSKGSGHVRRERHLKRPFSSAHYGESEAQRVQVTYPRSHRLSRINLGLKPLSLDSRSSAWQHFKTLFFFFFERSDFYSILKDTDFRQGP